MSKDKFFSWAFYAFVFTIPLSQFVSTRLLAVILLLSFFIKPGNEPLPRLLRQSWDIGLYLLVLIVGCFYTNNITDGFKVLETNFSFLALPLVVYKIRQTDPSPLKNTFYAFSAGLLVAMAIVIVNAGVDYMMKGNLSSIFSYALTEPIHSHPTYFAYYLIFAITVALYFMYYERIALPIWLAGVLVVLMFILLLLTSGSTAFIAILLVLSFFILKYLLEQRTTSKHVVFTLVCVMLTFFFLVQFLDSGQEALRGDYWERTSLWESALKANYNPVFGVGTGDYTTVLNDYYTTHGLENFAEGNYNSHNQFVQVYLSNGIIGLFCLLLVLVRPLYLAMTKDQVLGVLVMFPFIIYGMNEVFLGRYQGVVFFALLHQVFVGEYVDMRRLNVFKPQ